MTETFSAQECAVLHRIIAARRDMRHFQPDSRVDEAVLLRLLQAAHRAPSVGLMQPWRFLRITDAGLRHGIQQLVETERQKTAEALAERQREFLRLKVEGIRDCAELLVVALAEGREAHVFGRRTLPEMDVASVACAIQNLWLAARAENLGMGWVSLFDPEALAGLLDMPIGSKPVAVLCLGPVEDFYPEPMLVTERWKTEQPLSALLFTNRWGETANA